MPSKSMSLASRNGNVDALKTSDFETSKDCLADDHLCLRSTDSTNINHSQVSSSCLCYKNISFPRKLCHLRLQCVRKRLVAF